MLNENITEEQNSIRNTINTIVQSNPPLTPSQIKKLKEISKVLKYPLTKESSAITYSNLREVFEDKEFQLNEQTNEIERALITAYQNIRNIEKKL